MVAESIVVLSVFTAITSLCLAGLGFNTATSTVVYLRTNADDTDLNAYRQGADNLFTDADRYIKGNISLLLDALNESRIDSIDRIDDLALEVGNLTKCTLDGNVTVLTADLYRLRSNTANVTSDRTALLASMADTMEDVQNIQVNITNLKKTTQSLTSNITGIQSIIIKIRSNITSISKTLSSINLAQNLSALASDTAVYASNVSVLLNRIDDIDQSITDIYARIEALNDTAYATAAASNISSFVEEFDALDVAIQQRAGGGELITSQSMAINNTVLLTVIDNSFYNPPLNLSLPDPTSYKRKYIRLLYTSGQNATVYTSKGAFLLDAINRPEIELEYTPTYGWIILNDQQSQFYPYVIQGNTISAIQTTTTAGQGKSVALSCDGLTMVVGAPYDNNDIGSFAIYTRSTVTTAFPAIGTYVTPKGYSGSQPFFGYVVDIDCHADTIAVGAYGNANNRGAVWIYAKNATNSWNQQGPVLNMTNTGYPSTCATNAEFGFSLALSGDGNTVVIGAADQGCSGFVQYLGSFWVLKRVGTVWGAIQSYLYPQVGQYNVDQYGFSVDLNHDGTVLVIGAPAYGESSGGTGDGENYGAAFVYLWNGTGFAIDPMAASGLIGPQATDGDSRGFCVAVSADGTIVASGAPGFSANVGAVLVFARVYTEPPLYSWVNINTGGVSVQPQEVVSSAIKFGTTIALSPSGGTLAVGAYADTHGNGALWLYLKTVDGAGAIRYVSATNGTSLLQNSGSAVDCAVGLAINNDGGTVAVGCTTYGSDRGGVSVLV